MASSGSGGVLVDFARFSVMRERHQQRRAQSANGPAPRTLEGVVVKSAEPGLPPRPEADPAPTPRPVRLGGPWSVNGPRPLPPQR